MSTEVLRIDPHAPDPAAIERAASVLLSGGLVAFPTETVYGLGALADDAACVSKIYAAKGRPAHNPLIAHVLGEAEARALALTWPPEAERLARAFWPGPLTLVVDRGPRLPPVLSAGLPSAALRAPRHPVAIALLRAVGRPVAAPSANPSNQLSPTRAEHVLKGLAGRVDLVLDAGPCTFGIESTVVDVTQRPAAILRPGAVDIDDLRAIVPEIVVPTLDVLDDDAPRASPGGLRRHYAPRARLVVANRGEMTSAIASAEPPVAVLTLGTPLMNAGPALQSVLPSDPRSYAAALFETLHALDDRGCRTIVIEQVPDTPAWAAVRDRLTRASAS